MPMPPARFCEFSLDAVEHRGRNLVTLYGRVAPWSWGPDRIGHSGADMRFGPGGWSPITQQRQPDPTTITRELVAVVGVEVYGVKAKACAERLGMNADSVSRAVVRASAREGEDRTFHEQRFDFEERLATPEAGSQATNKVRNRYRRVPMLPLC